jgi:uridine kinase
MLKAENIKVKILYLDSYYKVPPAERTAWRKENGIESIGPDEYDWDKVNENIDAFLKDKKATLPMVDLFTGQMDQLTTDFKEIDVLIVAGLYSMKVEKADLKVFIENTYKDTMSVQKLSGKEELDEYRMQVLAQEHKVVQSLKKLANFYVDFDTNIEAMRLV